MRVKTKVAIDINITMTTSVNEILYMNINHYVYSNDFNKFEVDGEYYYETIDVGPAVKTVIKTFSYSLDGAGVDVLFASLDSPTETDKHLIDREVAYMAGLKVMASEYSIAEADLEIEV